MDSKDKLMGFSGNRYREARYKKDREREYAIALFLGNPKRKYNSIAKEVGACCGSVSRWINEYKDEAWTKGYCNKCYKEVCGCDKKDIEKN